MIKGASFLLSLKASIEASLLLHMCRIVNPAFCVHKIATRPRICAASVDFRLVQHRHSSRGWQGERDSVYVLKRREGRHVEDKERLERKEIEKDWKE